MYKEGNRLNEPNILKASEYGHPVPGTHLIALWQRELNALRNDIEAELAKFDVVMVDWESVNMVIGSQYGRFSQELRDIDPSRTRILFINMNPGLLSLVRTVLELLYPEEKAPEMLDEDALARYHRLYDNRAYTELREAVFDVAATEDTTTTVMNLITDSAILACHIVLNKDGVQAVSDKAAKLIQWLNAFNNPSLTDKVYSYLNLFNPTDEETAVYISQEFTPKPAPEVIISIKEVEDFSHDGDVYDGWVIQTTRQKILLLVTNSQSCCESWGCITSDDNVSQFEGTELRGVSVVDTALNTKVVEDLFLDEGGVSFINIETNIGVLQLAVYNAHNGYYGHQVHIEFNGETQTDYI